MGLKGEQKVKFNDFQQQAIDTRDMDILVSAGAGSGKTGTMIERISSNIINRNVTVDKLLVVTFTNAAASEMRKKLEVRLKQIIKDPSISNEERVYLKNQIDLLGQSDISTLHKFCQTIIKKYFYVVDLDPDFELGDDSQTAVLKDKAIEDLFLSLHDDKEFNLLASTFDDKRNYDKIKNYVYKIHTFLTNQPDVELFKQKINQIYQVDDLDKNLLTTTLSEYVGELFEYYVEQFTNLKKEAFALKLDSIVSMLDGYISQLSRVNRKNTFLQNHYFTFVQQKLELLRKSKKDDDTLAYMKAKVKDVREEFHKYLEKVQKNLLLSNNVDLLKQNLLDTKEVLLAMFNLVEKFEARYLELKLKQKLLDFSDLEHFAYKILLNSEVAEQVKKGYKQIYVDEYQDVNDIQESIINIIHSGKDLFLVGDVKQSIYGFRNTNPQIFLEKLGVFSKLVDNKVAIVFSENYRTDQRILNLVNFVFSSLMTTELGGINYNPEHMMHNNVLYIDKPEYSPQIEFDVIRNEKTDEEDSEMMPIYQVSKAPLAKERVLELARTEGQIISQKIAFLLGQQKTFYDAKAKLEREIKYSDITLLCRGRTEAVMEITKTLASNGIPVAQINKNNIFLEYEIQLLVSFLKLVYNPHDDISLLNLLTSPMVGVNEEELTRVRAYARDNIEDENKNIAEFYGCVLYYIEAHSDELTSKLKYALRLVEEGQKVMENGTIFVTLNDFCEKTDYLSYVRAMLDGINKVNSVLGFINSFVDKGYNTDLVDFIKNLDLVADSFSVEPELSVGVNCVNVETMHQSKGLEYPIVFLIDMGHSFNTEEQNGDFLLNSNLGVGVFKYDSVSRVKIPTISLGAVKVAMTNKAYAENVRLLYVAMTRAKNNLFVTGSVDLKKMSASLLPFALKNRKNFMELLLACCGQNTLEAMLDGADEIDVDINAKNKLKIKLFDPIDENCIIEEKTYNENDFCNINANFDNILTKNDHYVYKFENCFNVNKNTSVTKLNKMNNQNLAVEDVEKDEVLSKQEEESIARGIAYHKVMQFIDFSIAPNEIEAFMKSILSETELKLVSVDKIKKAVESISKLTNGAKLMREQPFLLTEKHNRLIESDVDEDVLVHGVIDLVIVRKDGVILLDYKTSESKNLEKTAKNYAKQLDCYAKAIEKTLHLPVLNKFLYFFLQERLLLVDI